jgi:hypothetical protein
VLERVISTDVAADGVMAVSDAVVSPRTEEEEFEEDELTLMPAVVVTV